MESVDSRGAPTPDRVTILTGVTGFLGREILSTLLSRDPDETLLVPVRASRGRSAAERVEALLGQMYPDDGERHAAAMRITTIETDLGAGDAGFDDAVGAAVSGRRCRVIHGAATVAFDHPLEAARRVNVEGTRRLLELSVALARIARFEGFAYISTAYVAGLREGPVLEDELDCGQAFTNTYEQSKLEAEDLVRSYRDRLPIRVFRPSIVAGHSSTGETSSFNVLYWPLKALARRLVLCIPGDPQSCYDIVPVDFVASALVEIADQEESVGGSYHLTAGGMVTLERIVEIAAEHFDIRRIPPYVSPRRFYAVIRPVLYVTLVGPLRYVMKTGDVYIPYLSKKLVFDNRNTAEALRDSELRLPDVEAYLKTIFAYAQETDFGKRKPEA